MTDRKKTPTTSIQIPETKLLSGDTPMPDNASITLSAATLRALLQVHAQAVVDRIIATAGRTR